jgi:hypothetical protein
MSMIIGADAYGDKDFLGIVDGFYENTASQRNFLQSPKKQGQTIALDLACRDGAQGCCTAARASKHDRTALLGPQDGQYLGCNTTAP